MRLERAGHGARGPHDAAGAGRRRQARLDLGELLRASSSPRRWRAQKRRQSGAGADALARVPAGEHGPGGEGDRRQAGAGCPHEQARAGSCRSLPRAPPRRAAGRGSWPRRPSPSGSGAACSWGGRRPRRARCTGNSSGSPPACQTPRLTAAISSGRRRWQWLRSLAVSMMPDDGLRERFAAQAHRPREGAPHEGGEVAVAVLDELAFKAAGFNFSGQRSRLRRVGLVSYARIGR